MLKVGLCQVGSITSHLPLRVMYRGYFHPHIFSGPDGQMYDEYDTHHKKYHRATNFRGILCQFSSAKSVTL